MDVSKLSDRYKSVMLARVTGLPIEPHPVHDDEYLIHVPPGIILGWELFADFYDIEAASLAWWVLNWASRQVPKEVGPPGMIMFTWADRLSHFWSESRWVDEKSKLSLYSMSLVDAQRLWLDYILELAINDDLIDMDKQEIANAAF